MNTIELKEAIERFENKYSSEEREKLYQVRKDFVKRFTISNLEKMTIDDYVIGRGATSHSFCYELERTLDSLGSILGSRSNKFGIYYSQKKSEYIFTQKYGRNADEAFMQVRSSIIQLLKAADTNNTSALIKNPIANTFKGKLLATYYPDKFLSVFSVDHLTHFIRLFGLEFQISSKADPILQREAIVDFKNSHPDMKNWSLDMFSAFLYDQFHPNSKTTVTQNIGKGVSVKQGIDVVSIKKNTQERQITKLKSPVDYVEEARKHQHIGHLGERIVMDYEIRKLRKLFGSSAKEAIKMIDWVSQKSDSFGYDIKSKNDDGTERYIEVKSTRGNIGDVVIYYTEHERKTAIELGDNYYIYIVYDVESGSPKVWEIPNPITKGKFVLEPIQYKINIKTKKD